MSSSHVFVRLARHHTVRAVRDESYARCLLGGHAVDTTPHTALEQLELSRVVRHALDRLDTQAPDLAETLHFALFGYLRHPTTKGYDSAWLHRGYDTGYGWPAVLTEPTVARLALELPAVADAFKDTDERTAVGQLAAFYQAAALAGQVMIVGEE
jgi:hypothetical protein